VLIGTLIAAKALGFRLPAEGAAVQVVLFATC
jgi:hypothetical protein